jgi:hypothetical protein
MMLAQWKPTSKALLILSLCLFSLSHASTVTAEEDEVEGNAAANAGALLHRKSTLRQLVGERISVADEHERLLMTGQEMENLLRMYRSDPNVSMNTLCYSRPLCLAVECLLLMCDCNVYFEPLALAPQPNTRASSCLSLMWILYDNKSWWFLLVLPIIIVVHSDCLVLECLPK